MAIPDYQACMLPLLKLAGDRNDHALKDAVPTLADQFQLTDAERSELLPSGQQLLFHNRVSWANTYLKKAGLLHSSRRGFFAITDRGESVLAQNPSNIDRKFLEQFSEFLTFQSKSKVESENDRVGLTEALPIQTPLETLEIAYGKIPPRVAR
jgi:restriction system protein